MAKLAVFLDRDGVLNIEAGYIRQVQDLNLIPGIAQAVRQLNDLEIFCCLVSNQSGQARGFYRVSPVDALHDRLSNLLHREAGSRLDALYYCPYLSPASGGTIPEFTRWSTYNFYCLFYCIILNTFVPNNMRLTNLLTINISGKPDRTVQSLLLLHFDNRYFHITALPLSRHLPSLSKFLDILFEQLQQSDRLLANLELNTFDKYFSSIVDLSSKLRNLLWQD